MFRPLARNAAVARLSTTPARYISHRHPTPFKFQYIVLANGRLYNPSSFASRCFASSSEPPSSKEKLASTSQPPPFQGTSATRKSNVDFRPAPRKTPQSSTNASAQPVVKSSASTESTSKSTSSTVTDAASELKETTKRDIEDAEAHGILTPPPPDAGWIKRTVHKGIQLAKFYYRGVKLIFVRRKEIAAIRARIRAGGPPLSRGENRFIRTQKDDVNKVVPFLIIALLLEEVIPLIAIYAPFMLPSTCILPSQRARIEEKKTERAHAYVSHYKSLFEELAKQAKASGDLPLDSLRGNDAALAVCGLLRQTTTGFDALRLRRIRKHLEFIVADDELLVRDNLLGKLSEQELNEALEERGFVIQDFNLKTKEARLKWWLDAVNVVAATNANDAISRRLCLLVQRT